MNREILVQDGQQVMQEVQAKINKIGPEKISTMEGKAELQTVLNWQIHLSLVTSLLEPIPGVGVRCPSCGRGVENLKWMCCNLDLEEAYIRAKNNYLESLKK